MATRLSGQQMLEASVSTCREIADGLGDRNAAWETSVVEIVDKFGEVDGTFFFQTMPSIPPTRTAMRDADALLELKNNGDWGRLRSAAR